MKFALSQGAGHLWVLEKNESAIRFYKGNGFFFTSDIHYANQYGKFIIPVYLRFETITFENIFTHAFT